MSSYVFTTHLSSCLLSSNASSHNLLNFIPSQAAEMRSISIMTIIAFSGELCEQRGRHVLQQRQEGKLKFKCHATLRLNLRILKIEKWSPHQRNYLTTACLNFKKETELTCYWSRSIKDFIISKELMLLLLPKGHMHAHRR